MTKAVILAGGLGSRLAEETSVRPKPMVEIGGLPILWHVMKIYSSQGINHFVICLGYRGYMIKEYFSNYFLHTSDVTFDMSSNSMEVHNQFAEPWRITLVDTGADTMTGGRLKRVLPFVEDDPFFHMTYGDGVGNVDIRALTEFHVRHGALATVTAVRPAGRFGMLAIEDDVVSSFREKPDDEHGWVNGGFFVLSPRVGNLIEDDQTIWERAPMERLADQRQLRAYRHHGFWQPMDTLRDKHHLESLWHAGEAPWRLW
ncbi:glucose-1-phosphate cytidylyltransferase [Methylobacterium durans]|uniref:glucose-1-phosphate cytidylyltransferase n=1 Tax=Methylobacterium durans TaxID=2202825 RepID=UPI002AFF40B1|nr:glucose-1-phosphate cytidylyltransferase [Methylobacterium durans]MEA1835253.1 glucose-1-phosphate cytidylyltransferase [Methylobacterium durans]